MTWVRRPGCRTAEGRRAGFALRDLPNYKDEAAFFRRLKHIGNNQATRADFDLPVHRLRMVSHPGLVAMAR